MPLVRSREQFEFERFDGVYFWMREGASYILCKISHEALRGRSVRDGEMPVWPTHSSFIRHRDRIEKIASENYDAAVRPIDLVLVLGDDLSPRPM